MPQELPIFRQAKGNGLKVVLLHNFLLDVEITGSVPANEQKDVLVILVNPVGMIVQRHWYDTINEADVQYRGLANSQCNKSKVPFEQIITHKIDDNDYDDGQEQLTVSVPKGLRK